MWELKEDFTDRKCMAQYAKRHRAEYVACFANLARLHAALEDGMTLQQCTFGFLGSEGMDVYRIGQTGVPHAHETRLYIYAEITGNEIQILTIGDKKSQRRDVRWCHDLVRKFREHKEHENEQEHGKDDERGAVGIETGGR